MTIRITTGLVRIEGKLDEVDVPLLLSECDSSQGELVLDLSGLRAAHEAGVRALRKLIADGATVQGASVHIARLLGLDAAPDTPEPGERKP